MLVLPSNLCALSRLTAKEPSRYSTESIRLQATTEGYQAMATDGRCLGLVTGPSDEDLEVPAELAKISGRCHEALIPGQDWSRVLRAAAKKGPALVQMAQHGTVFLVGNTQETLPAIEGRFPDVGQLLKQQCRTVFKVAVNGKMLAELVQVATAFSGDALGDNPIYLHFAGSKKLVLLTTGNDRGQKFVGVLMPLT
jgi:hypothetical protein